MMKFIFIFLVMTSSLFSYESEKYLRAVIIGKIAKYVQWNTPNTKDFTIVILHNPFGHLLDTI